DYRRLPGGVAAGDAYYVGEDGVAYRFYWDREKTRLHSECLFITTAGNGVQHLHGVQREWHANGQLKSESPYRLGQRHGTSRQWNDEGRLLGSFVMRDGTGTFRMWYDNGLIERSLPLVAGKLLGEARSYYDNGSLAVLRPYHADKLHG